MGISDVRVVDIFSSRIMERLFVTARLEAAQITLFSRKVNKRFLHLAKKTNGALLLCFYQAGNNCVSM